MIDWPATFFAWTTAASFGLLFLALILASIRMIKGPSLADRVVALDFVAVVLIGFAALLAGQFGQSAFLDLAMALALIAFLAAAAFARYAERRRSRETVGDVS